MTEHLDTSLALTQPRHSRLTVAAQLREILMRKVFTGVADMKKREIGDPVKVVIV